MSPLAVAHILKSLKQRMGGYGTVRQKHVKCSRKLPVEQPRGKKNSGQEASWVTKKCSNSSFCHCSSKPQQLSYSHFSKFLPSYLTSITLLFYYTLFQSTASTCCHSSCLILNETVAKPT